MKKEELNKTIEHEIEEINQQLTILEDEKDKLIQLQSQLEMQKREEENKAWTERVIQARTKEQKRNLGRKNSKFGLLNKFKELRQIRKDKLDG